MQLAERMERLGELLDASDALVAAGQASEQIAPAPATRCYEKAIELRPDQPEVLAALSSRYRDESHFAKEAQTLRRRLSQAREPALRTPLVLRLAELQLHHQECDSGGTTELLEAALDIDREEPRLWELLARARL